jgi:transcriptional antiterminator NusG
MSTAFEVFVRNEDKVLLLLRADGVADFPGFWDGVYGIGDVEDHDMVLQRVEECTGIPTSELTVVRSGAARGVDFGGRLVDITPLLVMTESTDTQPRTLYDKAVWIDPGEMQNYPTVFTDNDQDGSEKLLREMYGNVSSFLYILKTSIGQEQNVAREIRARLSGTGSLKDVQGEVFSVLHPHQMRGYVFVEASAEHHVEALIGRAGGITTPMKNCRKVLGGESPLQDVSPYLEPKAATAGIEEGCVVEIRVGAFKGERARVTSVSESKEEVTVELFEAAVPIPITVRGDQVRVTQRVE